MKSNKQYIALFFLIFFIGTKFIGLHTLTHSDLELNPDCEICEYTIASNETPFIANQAVTFELPIQAFYQKQQLSTYAYQFISRSVDNALFSRPPPVI